MRVAVGGTWKAIFHASKRLQNDQGILLLATSQDPRALEVIAPRAGETKRGEDLKESASGEQEGKEKAAETPWAKGIERALKPLLKRRSERHAVWHFHTRMAWSRISQV